MEDSSINAIGICHNGFRRGAARLLSAANSHAPKRRTFKTLLEEQE